MLTLDAVTAALTGRPIGPVPTLEEVWMRAYCASIGAQYTGSAASRADAAVIEYKKRWIKADGT
jgi:hypothetical protein